MRHILCSDSSLNSGVLTFSFLVVFRRYGLAVMSFYLAKYPVVVAGELTSDDLPGTTEMSKTAKEQPRLLLITKWMNGRKQL